MRILIIEDEKLIARPLSRYLTQLGYAVDWAQSGKSGLQKARINNYDCILLDLNLPEIDGIEVSQKIRKDKIITPIIMVTARHQLSDKLLGFESGADDYISKPFNLKELEARIKALIRRSSKNKSFKLKFAIFRLNNNTNILTNCKTNQKYILTAKESAILEYLIRNINKTITSEELIEHVWNEEVNPFSDTVKTHIKTLRNKFDPNKKYIQTVRGKGYILLSKNEI